MTWEEALKLKADLDRLGVRVLALEHPNEQEWHVVAHVAGYKHRHVISDPAAWWASVGNDLAAKEKRRA